MNEFFSGCLNEYLGEVFLNERHADCPYWRVSEVFSTGILLRYMVVPCARRVFYKKLYM